MLALAAGVRLWRLDAIPPGFTHDEAGHGHDALAILHGARPVYQTVGYGREPLYDYLLAGLMALIGPPGRALRFSSVPLGLLTLLLTYLWVRAAFDRPTALAATALQAASFWSLTTARQALRSGLLPVLFTAAACFFWRIAAPNKFGNPGSAMPLKSAFFRVLPRPALPLFAVFLGATFWTYIPARVLWIIFPLFLGYLALFHHADFRRAALPVAAGVAAALLIAAPLFLYLRAHPQAEQRLAMLDAPLQALRAGDASILLARARDCLAGFFLPGRGDTFLAYTIPGRPFFDPLTGALFVAGVLLCLARWRRPACAFALLWFAVGVSPSLITGPAAATTRSIAALPVAFLFPVLPIIEIARLGGRGAGSGEQGVESAAPCPLFKSAFVRVLPRPIYGWIASLALAALVTATGVSAARDYFGVWGESPHVRAAYQHPLTEIAARLDAAPEAGATVISTVYPQAPHDPYVLEMSLRRRDLALRWSDGRRALIIPAAPAARLIAPSAAALDPYFAALPGLRLRERVALRPDDLDPLFNIYDWTPPVTLGALRERMSAASADFGGVLFLLGYDARLSDGSVEMVTLWQANASPGAELVLFTHALDAAGGVIAQEDRLDAPAWDWRPGDAIVQIHRFAVPSDPLTLEIGVYRAADLVRLPLVVDGQPAGDHLLLPLLEVTNQ